MEKEVIIIGAGPGGLASAMLLAHEGYKVTIYEQKKYVGGRNSSFKIKEFKFDLGPTFFMMKNVLEDIFKKTGRELEDYVTLREIDPMYKLSFENNKKNFYPSRNKELMKNNIEEFSPSSFNKYEKYLKSEKKKYNRLIPCLQVPYGSILDFFSERFIGSIPYLDAHVSLYDVLSRYFNDENLKLAFTFQAKYIGMSPWNAPGTFSIISYIEHGGGIYHVEGGLSELSKSMADSAIEDGASLKLDSKVKKIIIKNNTAIGVELENGDIHKSDHIIINADFSHAMTHLVPENNRKKYNNQKLYKKKYSCSTFMIYLGLDKIYDNIPHHSIFFANDYKKNVDDITDNKILSDDFSFYIQNASLVDETLAPKGKSTLYILVPVPNNKSGINWKLEQRKIYSKILNYLEKKVGLKHIKKHIEVEKIISPYDWENTYSVYLGATFNLGHNLSQMLLFRPHNKFEEFKNCYLVGGGTHPGSGLPTIYQSAIISSELIMKNDGLSK